MSMRKPAGQRAAGGESSIRVLDETGRSTVPREAWPPRTGAWHLAAVTCVTLGTSFDFSDASRLQNADENKK